MTAVKLPLVVLSLPTLAVAIGASDGQFSREDWGSLGVALAGSLAITAKEIEARWLRAKLNDPRYLLRRGLAMLDKRREVPVVLAGAVAASLLVAALGSWRGVDAWDRPFIVPVHAFATPLHKRPVKEVTSERATPETQTGPAPVQRGRSELVGRPPMGGLDQGTGVNPAGAGQQCVPPADERLHSGILVPGMDVCPDLPSPPDGQGRSLERQGVANDLDVQPRGVPSGGRAAPPPTKKSPPSRTRTGQEGKDG